MARFQLIDDRTFDPDSGDVCAPGRRTRLEPQPAALLALLAARPGELVTRDEIAVRLWGDGRHVDVSAGVHYAVAHVRRALGEPDVIETLPRRGYRLRPDAVLPAAPTTRETPALASAVVPVRRRPAAMWLMAAAVLVAVVAVIERRPNDHHAVAVSVLRAVHDLVY